MACGSFMQICMRYCTALHCTACTAQAGHRNGQRDDRYVGCRARPAAQRTGDLKGFGLQEAAAEEAAGAAEEATEQTGAATADDRQGGDQRADDRQATGEAATDGLG